MNIIATFFLLHLIAVVVMLASDWRQTIKAKHLERERFEAEAAQREAARIKGLQDLGPPPACRIAGISVVWEFLGGREGLPAVVLTSDAGVFSGWRLASKPLPRHAERDRLAGYFDTRYALTVSHPGGFASFSRAAREALIKAHPCRVEGNRFFLIMPNRERYDIDADPFAARRREVETFLAHVPEPAEELPALLIMAGADPEPVFRRRALLAALDLFFAQIDRPLADTSGTGIDRRFSFSEIALSARRLTPEVAAEKFALHCPAAVRLAFTTKARAPLFGGLVHGLLKGYNHLIAARAVETMRITASRVQGELLFFLACVFPERVTVAEITAWGARSEILPTDLAPLVYARLAPAPAQAMLRVMLVKRSEIKELVPLFANQPANLELAEAVGAETNQLTVAYQVLQLFLQLNDPRSQAMVAKVLALLEAGVGPEKERLEVVVGMLQAVAVANVADEVSALQRLAPMCYTYATRQAFAAARAAMAQRTGLPLVGLLSTVSHEDAGALSPVTKQNGDLSRPAQPEPD